LFLFAKQTNPSSQTGGQWYSDTSPFSIPWLEHSWVKGQCHDTQQNNIQHNDIQRNS